MFVLDSLFTYVNFTEIDALSVETNVKASGFSGACENEIVSTWT